MATSERMQQGRKQCLFRLAAEHCPLRKLARKLRANNTYNMPAEPSENFSAHWHSFSTVSGHLASLERNGFNPLDAGAMHMSAQAPMQSPGQGPPLPAFPLHQIQVELNREPSLWSIEMEIDPETGERA